VELNCFSLAVTSVVARRGEAIPADAWRSGRLMFGAEHDPNKAIDRHLFDKWLAFAERKAGLPKLVGGFWHPYRRTWATERKHLSITDVAEAGGWKDTATLVTCYQ
jgi:hypothetical protein